MDVARGTNKGVPKYTSAIGPLPNMNERYVRNTVKEVITSTQPGKNRVLKVK